MDDKSYTVYVTTIPVYTHYLIDEHMVLGDCRFFVDLEVPYRQIGAGYRAASSEAAFRCVAPHWHIITPHQETPLTLYAVDGCLAIKWETVESGVLDVILRMLPGEMRTLTLRQMNTPVMDQLETNELRRVIERLEIAFLSKIVGDMNHDD